jgi:putative ABC transport system ATP-binding protein
MVALSDIHKTFNKGTINERVVFTGFDMSVRAGEFVSVVGSNGSGKTTILNIICGTIPQDSGSVSLGGAKIDTMPEHARSRRIGRVHQDPAKGAAGTLTITENMALADNKGGSYALRLGVNRRKVQGYRDMVSVLGLSLENQMNSQVASLSGGQRQALSLLIATMTPIDLLILDEHTASLDPKSGETVMDLTRRIVSEKKLTTIMVTHNLRYAVNFGDRLVMMHQGSARLDLSGEARQSCSVEDLLHEFNSISIETGNGV